MRIFLILFLTFFCPVVFANTDTISEIINYFSSLQSVALEFIQTDSDSQSTGGALLISKPYKFRCNYYPPYPLLITGNKNYISIYDYDMKSVSRISSRESPFFFLFADRIDINNFEILDTVEEDQKIVATLMHKETASTIEISINKFPRSLQYIAITEQSGKTIELQILSITTVTKFDNGLFSMQDPDTSGPPPHLDREGIKQKYM